MTTPTELFALWQEADGLATGAERVVSKALTDCANGGPAPAALTLEVAQTLRQTATKRLQAAVEAYRLHNDIAR